jgi:hypothetical protein
VPASLRPLAAIPSTMVEKSASMFAVDGSAWQVE